MNVLVTGGAGFIGSHLVRRLLEDGHNVKVLDNLSTGFRENLKDVLGDIELMEGDICTPEVVRLAATGTEIIFHQAAIPSVPRSIEDPVNSIRNNLLGTAELLNAAVKCNVRRVIYAASSSAYGDNPVEIKVEDLLPETLSPYAVGKLAGEYLLQAFYHSYGLETVGIRYFNVFGERQDPSSQYSGVIAKFCRQILKGEKVTINGDGSISRDFTYVANVVEGNVLAAEAAVELVGGKVFNVACGESITLNMLFAELCEVLGRSAEVGYGPSRKGDILHSRAGLMQATDALAYRPIVSFKDGLRRTADWYQKQILVANR